MTNAFRAIRKEWAIILILIVAFIARIWGLTFQSLWLDELHNMNEASPSLHWKDMFFYLKCCDQHPPLYFIIERLAFTIFGHTEFVARFISVIAGTASVWALYFLGKEVHSKSLGYIAAILTCVNYYNISYSQEARGYIFAFLFAALSFAYFIRLIKSPERKNIILYAVFTLLLLYSHYYSLFVVASQGLLALLFILAEGKGPGRVKLFKSFLFSGLIVMIGYAPWLPFMLEMANLKSFWISEIPTNFIISYFNTYFGNYSLLKPFLLLLLIIYIIHVFLQVRSVTFKTLKDNPAQLVFIVALFWIFITYLIPYVRSLLVVPMLLPRYTIVVLPAFILVLAYGIEVFKAPYVKIIITALFVILSLIFLTMKEKYYTAVHKTQFREMTQFVVTENSQDYPIINQVTSWHQEYYLNRLGSKAKVIVGNKASLIDSIVMKSSPQWDLDGFWIVGAHGDKPADPAKLATLDKEFVMVKSQTYYDAWAQLFVSRKKYSGKIKQ